MVRSTLEDHDAGGDAYLNFIAEDVEIHPDESRFPEAKPFRGREQLKRFIADTDGGWEGGAKSEITEIFPVGDRVVARVDWGGKGRASGIDVRSSLTSIYTVRDGKIVKIEFFFDHAQALKAVELSE